MLEPSDLLLKTRLHAGKLIASIEDLWDENAVLPDTLA
jgi:hypothetical protein